MTHTDGDWKTADQLSEGFIAVDGYALFTRVLTDAERSLVQTAATSASTDCLSLLQGE